MPEDKESKERRDVRMGMLYQRMSKALSSLGYEELRSLSQRSGKYVVVSFYVYGHEVGEDTIEEQYDPLPTLVIISPSIWDEPSNA